MSEEVILVAAALGTSIISGFMGMAGGILLLTIMAQFLAPAVLIPLHGIVQLGSNSFRTFLLRPFLKKSIVLPFAIGGLFGAAIGSQIVISIPEQTYRIVLAVLILVLTWLPKFKSAPEVRGKFLYLGSSATFLSFFMGATGPFLAPFFLRESLSKEELVVNKAACQTVVHSLKIAVFGFLGFQLGEYGALIGGMLLATFLGNWIGKQVLTKIPEKLFLWLFRLVITGLTVRMIWVSLF